MPLSDALPFHSLNRLHNLIIEVKSKRLMWADHVLVFRMEDYIYGKILKETKPSHDCNALVIMMIELVLNLWEISRCSTECLALNSLESDPWLGRNF